MSTVAIFSYSKLIKKFFFPFDSLKDFIKRNFCFLSLIDFCSIEYCKKILIYDFFSFSVKMSS